MQYIQYQIKAGNPQNGGSKLSGNGTTLNSSPKLITASTVGLGLSRWLELELIVNPNHNSNPTLTQSAHHSASN